MIRRLLDAPFVPKNIDLGLLFLRVGTGLILFTRHGWEKVSILSLTNPKFPSVLGLGHTPTWIMAMLSDGIFSLLLILGIGTRWIALYSFTEIFVAWAVVHHFTFLGKSPGADHGELIALYLSAFLALMVTGGGRYSVDAILVSEKGATLRKIHA